MKQISFVALFLLGMWIQTRAGNEKNIVTANLRSATVYRAGAELTHTAKVTLDQGNNELVIDGVSNRIVMNSLQIGNDGNVTILSSTFSTDFLKPIQKTPGIKRLEDSLESVNRELAAVQVAIKTDQELLDLLKSNKTIGGTQTGLSVAELTKMVDYYRSKTLELQKEMGQYREKETKLLDLISKLTLQLKEEEQKNTKTVGKLLLQLYSPAGGTYNFTISYITPLASWQPTYDLKVENINKPVKLSYKAKLTQTTGIDWQRVKLTLATSAPNQDNNAPVLKSWFLSYQYPGGLEQALAGKAAGLSIRGASSQLDEVVVVGYGSRSKEESSDQREQVEPVYILNGNIISKKEYNKIDPRAIKDVKILKDASATSLYGSRASGGAIVVTLKNELSDYVSVNDNELNVTFEIDLPYDVPTNGKEQQVSLKDFTVPAQFKYYTAPRVDKDAYLLADIADWESLNLLPGEANIIFEGTYIGKTHIDPNATLDTLNFTLGRDKRVVVTREKLKDFSSVKFLGSNKKQVFTYEITVKNNKKEKVQLMVKDQYPISTNKDIEVELIEISGANNNTELGILNWLTELAPGESKKYRVSYSVKYPKDKVVNVN
jgi:TonB-dependent SusC/RagA subfamily outer membrane receptor